MRKVIASTYATLDGYIDDPQNWSFDYRTDDANQYALDLMRRSDALLSGRLTYEGFASVWPTRPSDEFSDRINGMHHYVVSDTLEKADIWGTSTIIRGENLVEEVTALKQQPGGDIIIYGNGRRTDAMSRAGLLDEYHLWVHPLIVGEGEPLFRRESKTKLKLLENRTFSSGLVILVYQPEQ
jgi:dihydrofolate reductase